MGLAYVKTLHVSILTRFSLIFFSEQYYSLSISDTPKEKLQASSTHTGPHHWQCPQVLLAASKAVTINVHTAVSTRHKGDSTQARTEHVDQTHQNRRKHESHKFTRGLQHLRSTSEPGWSAGKPPDFHTTLTTTSTAGTTGGATEEEEHAALKAYNRSRGQSKHQLACLPLKNKTKQTLNTQCCK